VVFLLASLTADKKYEQAYGAKLLQNGLLQYKELVKLDGASFKGSPPVQTTRLLNLSTISVKVLSVIMELFGKITS
jgi:hypothetical protein